MVGYQALELVRGEPETDDDRFNDALLQKNIFFNRQRFSHGVIGKVKHKQVGLPWYLCLLFLVLRGGF